MYICIIILMYLIIVILFIQISKAWQILKVMYTDPYEILQKNAPAPKEDVANTSNIAQGITKSSGMEQSNASKQSSKYKEYHKQHINIIS